ncbi:MAG: DNA polymerase, partial [Advenella sp.]
KQEINDFYATSKNQMAIVDRLKIKRFRGNYYEKLCASELEKRKMTSMDLIRMLFNLDAFIPITYDDLFVLGPQYHDFVQEDYKTLEYMDCDNITYKEPVNKDLRNVKAFLQNKENDKNKVAEIKKLIFYADFEASTDKVKHQAYCVSVRHKYTDSKKFFYGFDCAKRLLDALPNYSIVYFHNLAYDGCFFRNYFVNAVAEGNKYYSIDLNYKGKQIFLKDSLKIINMPLASFPLAFNLKSLKEIFPYNLYTEERIIIGKWKISDADEFEKVRWNEKQKQLFTANCDRISATLPDGYFDLKKYVKFYCEQDTYLLKEGMVSFGNDIQKTLKIDIDAHLTISSISQSYFTKTVYRNWNLIPDKVTKRFMSVDEICKVQGWSDKQKKRFKESVDSDIVDVRDYYYKYASQVYKNGGVIKSYLSQFVTGGRCMLSENKKQISLEEIEDEDVNSLYPSAFSRLYVIEGKPQVIKNFKWVRQHEMKIKQLQQTEEKFISAFVCRINITKVNVHLNFPMICIKKDGLNHYINEPGKMNVDNIMLKLLEKYHQIEYEFIDGYYWGCPPSEQHERIDYTGRKDINIREIIKKLYEERQRYKAADSSVERVIKDTLNTCYGRTIQKIHRTNTVYINKEDVNAYCEKNNYKVINIEPDFTPFKSKIIELKEISDEFTSSLIGIQILSMSKKMMNQAFRFCDKEAMYQDTDSIHLKAKDAIILKKQYEEHYKRPFTSKKLGDFSSDFGNDTKCLRSIYCGKKAYYCDLLKKVYKNIQYRKGTVEKRIDLNINLNQEVFECHYETKLSMKLARFSKEFEVGKSYEVTFKLNNIDHVVSFNVEEEREDHVRMKGVPNKVVIHYCKINNLTLWHLYMKLYNGEAITFDLTSIKVCFKFVNLTVGTQKEFERKIIF